MIFAGYVGSPLLAGAYLAISCMTSAMTRNQVISFILSVVICFFPDPGGLHAGHRSARRAGPIRRSCRRSPHFQRDDALRRHSSAACSICATSCSSPRVIGFALFTTGVIIRNQRAGLGTHETRNKKQRCGIRPAASIALFAILIAVNFS